jgi:hypothetical protein
MTWNSLIVWKLKYPQNMYRQDRKKNTIEKKIFECKRNLSTPYGFAIHIIFKGAALLS